MANALPPTTEGVIAEVKAHIISVRIALFHVRSGHAIVWNLHAKPKSRPTTNISANARKPTVCQSRVSPLSVSALMSRKISQAATPNPNTNGKMVRVMDLRNSPAIQITV